MHPDHRVLTIRQAFQEWERQPEGGLWLWMESADWLGLGLGERRPTRPLWRVQARQDGQVEVQVFLHTPDEAARFRTRWPDLEVPAESARYPVVQTLRVPVGDAPRLLEDLLHDVFGVPEEADIIWYGRSPTAVYNPRVYSMGCLSLVLLGLIGLLAIGYLLLGQ
ncbi:hypothetical protein HRbin11_01932 [bacterium HR11]|nr:hypothetical protein HRbin11_01932 [bacterium HR11]